MNSIHSVFSRCMARAINRRSSKTDTQSVSLTEAAQQVVLFRTVIQKTYSQSELSTHQAFLQAKELVDLPWHSEEELATEAGILHRKGLPSSSTVRDQTMTLLSVAGAVIDF